MRRGRIREALFLFSAEISLDLNSDASAILFANAQRCLVLGAAGFAVCHVDELELLHTKLSSSEFKAVGSFRWCFEDGGGGGFEFLLGVRSR